MVRGPPQTCGALCVATRAKTPWVSHFHPASPSSRAFRLNLNVAKGAECGFFWLWFGLSGSERFVSCSSRTGISEFLTLLYF